MTAAITHLDYMIQYRQTNGIRRRNGLQCKRCTGEHRRRIGVKSLTEVFLSAIRISNALYLIPLIITFD